MSIRPIDNLEAGNLAELASQELYRVRALSWAAMVLVQTTDLFGEDELFRMDALTYQLEEIHGRAKQNETMFSDAASAIVRERIAKRESQQAQSERAQGAPKPVCRPAPPCSPSCRPARR